MTRLALRSAPWATLRAAPGAALNAPCPGYGFTAVCNLVARTDAQHRLRGVQRLCSLLGYSARCSR
ncbi:TPA: hypothetical protein ACYSA2_005563, partial [Klebsiella oxytoca]